MIWATVSSRSCFYWLYRASPYSTIKNITNLISLLTIWWFPCLESSLVFEKRGFAVTNVFSPQNTVGLCPASSGTPRPSLPLAPGVSWLPYFCFQSLMMKRKSFSVLVVEGVVNLYRTSEFSFFGISGCGVSVDYWDVEWFVLETNILFCHFSDSVQVLHFGLFSWLWGLVYFF